MITTTATHENTPKSAKIGKQKETIARLAADLDRILNEERRNRDHPKRIISFGQDRLDLDILSSAALFDRIARKEYDLKTTCAYSRRIRFLENRRMASYLSAYMGQNFITRVETSQRIPHLVDESPAILVFDTSNFGMISGFDKLVLETEAFKEGKKPVIVIDHHIDSNNGKVKGESPSAYDISQVHDYRFNAGANASVMIALLSHIGTKLDIKNPQDRAAVISAYLGIRTDTEKFNPEYISDIDGFAIETLERVLDDKSRNVIDEILKTKPPADWTENCRRAIPKAEVNREMISIAGLGAVNDSGIVPYVASELIASGKAHTSIVYAIAYEELNGKIEYISLLASGRTHRNDIIDLPRLFGEAFVTLNKDGVKVSKGGGRPSADGLCAMAGAEIPLQEFRKLSSEELQKTIWPRYSGAVLESIFDRLPATEDKYISMR